MITVSVVSHGHGEMVEKLIIQLINEPTVAQIILTLNISEFPEVIASKKLIVIRNNTPLGFSLNHNNAFKMCSQPFFCVLNPDIVLLDDPFEVLLECLQNKKLSLVAPIIMSPAAVVEDSAREFPTLPNVVRRLFFPSDGRWPIDWGKCVNYPDWVAGMFMLFTSSGYGGVGGFDERYFLYYEDVDLCRRMRSAGFRFGLCTKAKAIHDAQRDSRKNIKFFFWHCQSMIRFLFFSPRIRKYADSTERI